MYLVGVIVGVGSQASDDDCASDFDCDLTGILRFMRVCRNRKELIKLALLWEVCAAGVGKMGSE